MPLIIARHLMLVRPGANLQRVAVESTVAVLAIAVPLLEELLILGLQLVVENDAADVGAFFAQAVGFLEVGAIDGGVVLNSRGL